MRLRLPALLRGFAMAAIALVVAGGFTGVLTDAARAADGAPSAAVSPTATRGLSPLMLPRADLSLFDPGNIISDPIFFDANSMTENDVQRFLEARVPSCAKGYTCLRDWRDDSRTTTADAMCGAYRGAAQERASTIIFKVAQACGISPKVIIVTLQKEQGLVTSTAPASSRFTIAMGQGCPDTAECDTRYYGFFNQVYGAAWQFKRYANPPGTSQYFTWYAPGKTWNVRYSPDASCGSSPVRVQNQATSNLYYYTPYQPNRAALAAGYGTGDSCSAYGNRNFFQYFTDWFGSTKSYPVTGGIGDAYQRAGGATGYLGIATSAETCGLDQGGCFQLFQGGQIHWTNATGGHATHGAILGRWSANGYERGWMGYPTSDENCTLIKGGCVQLFQNGQVHWTNPTGAQATRGAILDRWASTGYERGELGYPTTSETCGLVRSGCSQTFENGLITWSSGSGAHILAGVYRQAWTDAGRQDGALGFPTTEVSCANGLCRQDFEGGTLLRSGEGPVSIVSGPIATAWNAAGGVDGVLGKPTSAQTCGLVRSGCFQYFEGGQIHWSPTSGAHATRGAVKDVWGALGWEGGSLGYPTSDLECSSDASCVQEFERGAIAGEKTGPVYAVMAGMIATWRAGGAADGALGLPTSKENCGLVRSGCFQYFAGGQIHWSPATGAWVTAGAVKDAWGATGWENGKLGYPTGALTCGLRENGCFQHFEGGDVHVSAAGAFPTWGAIRNAWAASGWENGSMGYPTGFEQCTSSTSCTQKFERGTISWTAAGGAVLRTA